MTTEARVSTSGRTSRPRRTPAPPLWPLLVLVATLLSAAATLWYLVALPPEVADELTSPVGTVLMLVGMCGLAAAGYVLARAHPGSVMAALLLATAFAWVAGYLVVGVAITATERDLPGTAALQWVTNWAWVPAQVLALLTLLRFPDGRLPSPRWRWAERGVLGWGGLTLVTTAFVPGPLGSDSFAPATNPLGLTALAGPMEILLGVVFALLPLPVLAAASAPVLRWRHAPPRQRRQLLWIAAAAVVLALSAPLSLASESGVLLQGLAFLLLPGAIGVAVLRDELWDLDLRRRFDRLRTVREQERERLRQDLHDSLGPLLGAVSMRAEAGRNLVFSAQPERIDALLADIGSTTEHALAEVRRLIDELGPSALVDQDLETALRDHVVPYEQEFPVKVSVEGRLDRVDDRTTEAAYLIATEAVRNAARHSGAGGCRLEVVEDGGSLRVTVTDDGRGLVGSVPGLGRQAMERRARAVGGELSLTTGPAGGACVHAELPGAGR